MIDPLYFDPTSEADYDWYTQVTRQEAANRLHRDKMVETLIDVIGKSPEMQALIASYTD